MSECSVVNEQIPLLIMEAVEGEEREAAYLHLESCAACAQELVQARQAWNALEALPDVPVPSSVRSAFLAEIESMTPRSNVISIMPYRRQLQRFGQVAAALVLVVGGFAGGRALAPADPQPEAGVAAVASPGVRIAESMVIPSSALDPSIGGNPDIQNVQFLEGPDGSMGLAFDVTSRMTVEGRPGDPNMVRLVSHILKNQSHSTLARSSALQWVRNSYSAGGQVDPELVGALAQLVRNDAHEGVRIRAVEALTSLPAGAGSVAREALVEALRNDPNPAVRIKAIEALAVMTSSGSPTDDEMLDTLREKASQEDENPYLRVKAAEVLQSLEL